MKAQGIKGVASWKLGLEDKAVWDVIADYVNEN
jgi:spore germination protein YaaH